MTAASNFEAVLEHVASGTDIIVPLANGEPVSVLDAIEAEADRLEGVRSIRCTRSMIGPTSTVASATGYGTSPTSSPR